MGGPLNAAQRELVSRTLLEGRDVRNLEAAMTLLTNTLEDIDRHRQDEHRQQLVISERRAAEHAEQLAVMREHLAVTRELAGALVSLKGAVDLLAVLLNPFAAAAASRTPDQG